MWTGLDIVHIQGIYHCARELRKLNAWREKNFDARKLWLPWIPLMCPEKSSRVWMIIKQGVMEV